METRIALRRPLSCCVLSLVGLVSCAPAPSELSSQEIAVIEEAVVRAFDAESDAVDRLDCSGIRSDGEDREPVFVTQGRVARTRDELRAACEKMLVGRTGASWANVRTVVHVMSPSVAYLVREGTYTITYSERPPRVLAMVISNVFERQGDSWFGVHFHESFIER